MRCFILIDDPDEEVFGVVSNRLIDFGRESFPISKIFGRIRSAKDIQERIELLIHRLHYRDLTEEMEQWSKNIHHDLLTGALLVARFQYPELYHGTDIPGH